MDGSPGAASASFGAGGIDTTMEQSLLSKALIESGEREKLKQYITQSLADSGWREDLKKHCVEYIQNKGVERVTIGEITSEIAPRGRATVPDWLKTELLHRLRTFAEDQGLELEVRRGETAQ